MSEPIPNMSMRLLSDAEMDLVGGGGGGLAEYTLIIQLISEAAVIAITTIGTKVSADFTNIGNKL
jgi:Flp pilus assembly pilin Flp